MKRFLMLIAVSGLAWAGCSRQENKSAGEPEKGASGNPITAPVDYLGAVGQAKRFAEKTVDTVSINKAIQLFYAQEDRFPKDLNELVSRGYIPALPSPPAGMRFAYNPQNGDLRIVSQP
jgi:hypothetical protein